MRRNMSSETGIGMSKMLLYLKLASDPMNMLDLPILTDDESQLSTSIAEDTLPKRRRVQLVCRVI